METPTKVALGLVATGLIAVGVAAQIGTVRVPRPDSARVVQHDQRPVAHPIKVAPAPPGAGSIPLLGAVPAPAAPPPAPAAQPPSGGGGGGGGGDGEGDGGGGD